MDKERRSVLHGLATALGATVGTGTAGASSQDVDASLPPGVTLFDLSGDGNFTVQVEQAPETLRDDARSRPIHVTSCGRSTVDYAMAIVEPARPVTVGDVERLAYDYYEGPMNRTPGADGGGNAPDETFLAVENEDGRHGMYLTYDDDADDGRADEQWWTHDVAARVGGAVAGTSGWFEFTRVEPGYEGQTFDDVVARFGPDARVLRVGVGRGNAVAPTTADVLYDSLVVNDETRRFPTTVVRRVSNAAPFEYDLQYSRR